jgi:lipopolysaccharide heptosyltransferase II
MVQEMEPQRILVIKLHGVGDVIWTTPFLTNLRRAYPGALIGFLTRQPYAPLLENNPDVDEVISLKKAGVKHQLDFLRQIRKTGYDLVVDLIGTPRSALIAMISGAGIRMGYDFGHRRYFYNRVLSAKQANLGHEVEFHLFPLQTLGRDLSSKDLVYNLTPEEMSYRNSVWKRLGLRDMDSVVGLLPTGGWACKRWAADKYAEIARRLLFDGFKPLVFWGNPHEHQEALEVVRLSAGAVMAPPAMLRQMAALLSGCRVVIGNDSGPLHVATALKVPVVAFYGPTDPKGQGPWGVPNRVVRNENMGCLSCNRISCEKPQCMEGIGVDQAWNAFKDLLSGL